jgi:ABC-2 type transport system permease protein
MAGIKVVQKDSLQLREDLEKGRITAIITIRKSLLPNPPYFIDLQSSDAVNPQNLQVLTSILNAIIAGINQQTYATAPTIALVNSQVQKIRLVVIDLANRIIYLHYMEHPIHEANYPS